MWKVLLLALALVVIPTRGYSEVPTLKWAPLHTNILPRPDPLYMRGPASGEWASDLQYFKGLWLVGDGFGGIWYSDDSIFWRRGIFTQAGRPRSLQNAPVRSITIAENGTVLATFLGGGSFADPEMARQQGLRIGQRAPIARSRDGINWEVIKLPRTCGSHFAATDGAGTWVIPGCDTSILVSEDDGLTWVERVTNLSLRLEAQGFIRGVWVMGVKGGNEGGIYYSRDLRSWQLAMRFPKTVAPKRTLRLNNTLLMTGTWSFIASSTDGVNWVQRHLKVKPSRAFMIQAGVWHQDYGYVLGGKRGIVMQSKDLVEWKSHFLPKGSSTLGLAVNPAGMLCASGTSQERTLMRRAIID